jgi:hypothetical protein
MERNHKEELNMDEMRLKLSTKLMRGIIAKLISKAIYKKFGYKVDIQLNDLDLHIIDGETKISTNVDVSVDSKEFMRILNGIGMD